MGSDPLLVGFALLLLFLLDTWVMVASVSLHHTSLSRLVGQMDIGQGPGQRALNMLISIRRRAMLTLRLLHIVILAVITLLAWQLLVSRLLLWAALLILALTLVLLAFWEEGLSKHVEARPVHYLMHLESTIRLAVTLFSPFTLLMSLDKEAGDEAEAISPFVTEDELKNLVDAGQQEGVLEQDERRMIYSIFDLGNTLAREVMVPRIDILALDVNTSLQEAAGVLLESGYSRLPVYEDSIDHILGLLYAKDLLAVWLQGDASQDLRSLLRPAYFVPEAKTVDALLSEMQAQRIHMSIVVDEYGGVAGLVTLEDIVEEIIGDIHDEYDQQERVLVQQISPDEYLFAGRVDLDDFNELLQVNLSDEESDTLAGYIYTQMGRVPAEGERLLVDGLELIVEEVSRQRIRMVRVRRSKAAASPAPEEPSET